MNKTIGDGLDALATAILVAVLLGFIYKCVAGLVHISRGYSQNEARCVSVSGIYGDGKCYVNGEEMFFGGEE